jgi:hypothetical protein
MIEVTEIILHEADEPDRFPIKGAGLPAGFTSGRGIAGDLRGLAQKPGNDASPTLYKPDYGHCE